MKPSPPKPKTAKKPAVPPAAGRARANAALLEAAAEGDAFGVYQALERGADVNTRDKKQRTPLLLALTGSGGGGGGAARSMAQTERDWERAAEQMAGGTGKIPPVIQLLLKAGAQVNLVDSEGNSPLLTVAAQGNDVLCRELLRRKANVNHRNRENVTPLNLAVAFRRLDVLDTLLGAGADLMRHGLEGKVPLLGVAVTDFERKKAESEDMQTMLLGLMTALMGAGDKEAGMLAVIDRLVRAGVNPNETGREGVTPLMLAALMASPRVVRHLIERGAKIDAALTTGPMDGSTALLFAALERRADNARVLIEAGANVQTANKRGDTALTLAAGKASYALVERLLAAGAKPDARTMTGQTARDLAAQSKYTAIVRLLDTHNVPAIPAK